MLVLLASSEAGELGLYVQSHWGSLELGLLHYSLLCLCLLGILYHKFINYERN